MPPRWSVITASDIDRAVNTLAQGGVVLHPTETVYGFGCDATSSEACDRIRQLKGWETGRPLIWLVSGATHAAELAIVTDKAATLMDRFWPGPLTIVMATPTGSTVAFRHSPHPITRQLVEGIGRPITSTSANCTGEPPPRSVAEVSWRGSRGPDLVLDAGPCEGAVGSTIVRCVGDGVGLLREGDLPVAVLAGIVEVERDGP